jgi:hypothetical protein
MRFGGLVINTVVCLTLAKWETVSGQFGGYLNPPGHHCYYRTDRATHRKCWNVRLPGQPAHQAGRTSQKKGPGRDTSFVRATSRSRNHSRAGKFGRGQRRCRDNFQSGDLRINVWSVIRCLTPLDVRRKAADRCRELWRL